MRLTISAALLGFCLLILASAVPSVSANRDAFERDEFRDRVERTLADHSARLSANEQFHDEIRDVRVSERLARLEESQTINTRLLFAILVSVLGLLLRDFISVLKKKAP